MYKKTNNMVKKKNKKKPIAYTFVCFKSYFFHVEEADK